MTFLMRLTYGGTRQLDVYNSKALINRMHQYTYTDTIASPPCSPLGFPLLPLLQTTFSGGWGGYQYPRDPAGQREGGQTL